MYPGSDGYSETDNARPWAYHDRDYGSRAMNAAKRLCRFNQEQHDQIRSNEEQP